MKESNEDLGKRWWAVVGIGQDDKAAVATDALEAALTDDEHEIRIMAA